MIIEEEIPRLGDWIWIALGIWVLVGLVLLLGGILVAVLFSIISRGPQAGLRTVGQRIKEGTHDLITTSPRRVYALSLLAIQEAIRRKVLYVGFGLFALLLLAWAWFLDPSQGTEPARLYMDIILTWTTGLVLLIAGLLAVFSLPGDIASHTITTVVTKPVRPTEIVLGRICGFAAIGSILLLVIGLVNYFFITRSLDHRHEINVATLERATLHLDEGTRTVFTGRTTATQAHVHTVNIDIARGTGETDVTNEHSHAIHQVDAGKSGSIKRCEAYEPSAEDPGEKKGVADQKGRIRVVTTVPHELQDGDLIDIDGVRGTTEANSVWVVESADTSSLVLKESRFSNEYVEGGQWSAVRFEVSGARDLMKARVPLHAAKLVFHDRKGQPKEGGINVGFEWDYRGFVEGGPNSLSRALLTFRDLDRDMFQQVTESGPLTLEMTLSVFRTHKSDIVSPIAGNIEFVNPSNGLRSDPIGFDSAEYSTLKLSIPHVLPGKMPGSDEAHDGATLFDDYVADAVTIDGQTWDGVLQVEISGGAQPKYYGQYLGVAKHDVYFVADEAAPAFNFLKGHLSIWLQMVLVVSIGVMFSTFLNGFVALLATGAMVAGSFLLGLMNKVINPEELGGASFESAYRVFTRETMVTALPPGFTTAVIPFFDRGVRTVMWAVVQALPNMAQLSSIQYVSQGFNIPWNNLAVQFLTVLGFVIPLCLLGHYIIKGRELAQ